MVAWPLPKADAAQLLTRSLTLSDSGGNAHNVNYLLGFNLSTGGTLGSIEIQFCANTSIVGDPCVAPWGFDALNVTVSNETGNAGFLVSPNSTVNDVILSRPPAAAATGPSSYTLGNIINPADFGSYYARVLTYPTTDATGPATDSGGLAFAINHNISVSATVPPYLLFCSGVTIGGFDCSAASGNYIDFGQLTPDHASAAVTQLLAATNAQGGYNIHVNGTTLTSGNNVITAMSGQTSQPGQSQFGMNLRANLVPQVGQDAQGPGAGAATAGYASQNHYRFAGGDAIAASSFADDWRKYTISYIVNINKDQPGGVYVATMTYVCLANF